MNDNNVATDAHAIVGSLQVQAQPARDNQTETPLRPIFDGIREIVDTALTSSPQPSQQHCVSQLAADRVPTGPVGAVTFTAPEAAEPSTADIGPLQYGAISLPSAVVATSRNRINQDEKELLQRKGMPRDMPYSLNADGTTATVGQVGTAGEYQTSTSSQVSAPLQWNLPESSRHLWDRSAATAPPTKTRNSAADKTQQALAWAPKAPVKAAAKGTQGRPQQGMQRASLPGASPSKERALKASRGAEMSDSEPAQQAAGTQLKRQTSFAASREEGQAIVLEAPVDKPASSVSQSVAAVEMPPTAKRSVADINFPRANS